MNIKSLFATTALAAAGYGVAFAAEPPTGAAPYATPGVENPVSYTFTAATTGDLSAWYLGTTALFTETLSLLVDGVDTGVTGLSNHGTAIDTRLDFGNVIAGQTLVFKINVVNTGDVWYSDNTLNSDGADHIYSANFVGSKRTIPSGTFVAFEDLTASKSDWNYNDEKFVFSNLIPHEFDTPDPSDEPTLAVPEPAATAMMLGGFGLLAFVKRYRSRRSR